jgi:hypothetical protein
MILRSSSGRFNSKICCTGIIQLTIRLCNQLYVAYCKMGTPWVRVTDLEVLDDRMSFKCDYYFFFKILFKSISLRGRFTPVCVPVPIPVATFRLTIFFFFLYYSIIPQKNVFLYFYLFHTGMMSCLK